MQLEINKPFSDKEDTDFNISLLLTKEQSIKRSQALLQEIFD
jgi:hypothetical protein